MSRPKNQSAKADQTAPAKPAPQAQAVQNEEVLTLAEAAAYLRLPEAVVTQLVRLQGLPGRFAGTDWRFLKSALQDWLRITPARGSREAVLSVAGAWKEDPYVAEELREIYRRRGRPITDEQVQPHSGAARSRRTRGRRGGRPRSQRCCQMA